MTAAVLALNDQATTGKLHPATQKALKRMWTVQREDGGFEWLKCGWSPMESDDDYGVAIGLIAAYAAPNNYVTSEAGRQGTQRLRDYITQNPPPTLHHTAMLLWADSYNVSPVSLGNRFYGLV